ncbi:hypothetical protein ACQ7CU_23005 [Chryseobacterium arthrosphaerae]|uniref:hypothetical protein n=1 Tax=Chryseobacterium arthrosphaerae TaxID=651561 RepID=UPI003D35511A
MNYHQFSRHLRELFPAIHSYSSLLCASITSSHLLSVSCCGVTVTIGARRPSSHISFVIARDQIIFTENRL